MTLSSTSDSVLVPSVFLRHRRPLRAVLIENQAWFVGRDLARLTNSHVSTRVIHKLDADQQRFECLQVAGGEMTREWLVSESDVYALLMVHFYHPENRGLRQWLSNEVVPALRDARQSDPDLPRRRVKRVQGQQLSVLDWQGKLWVRFGDAVGLMEREVRRES